jgi:hypothetical protein
MRIRNKKNGTNVLAFENTRVIIKAGETIEIPSLVDFNQITNKADFEKRGWFEIVEDIKVIPTTDETSLEKAKKEVREYTSESKKTEE